MSTPTPAEIGHRIKEPRVVEIGGSRDFALKPASSGWLPRCKGLFPAHKRRGP
jgi:hypothetical protein